MGLGEKKAYKNPQLSRGEMVQVWELATDSKPIRVYQEGLEDGERSLILHILTRKFSCLTPKIRYQIELLSLKQLEALSEVLLDFSFLTELTLVGCRAYTNAYRKGER